jgi:Cu/Ag efflux protein CusF
MVTRNNNRRLRPLRVFAVLVALLVGGALTAFAAGMSTMTTTIGTISAVNGSTLTVTLPDNSTRNVTFSGNTMVVTRQAAALSDLASGDPLAVVAIRQPDGTLQATQVLLYTPQLWAFVQKGEITGPTGQPTFNGTVSAVSADSQPPTVTVAYNDTTSTINVPSGTGVYRLVAADPTTLAVGQEVNVGGSLSPDGTVAAATIIEKTAG